MKNMTNTRIIIISKVKEENATIFKKAIVYEFMYIYIVETRIVGPWFFLGT